MIFIVEIILKTMFNPFTLIFVILELKFFLSVAQREHGAKHKLLKKMLHIRRSHIGRI